MVRSLSQLSIHDESTWGTRSPNFSTEKLTIGCDTSTGEKAATYV